MDKVLTFTTHAAAAAEEARYWRSVSIVTSIDGIAFVEAWAERLEAPFGDHAVAFLGRRHLIENKLSTGSTKDRLDVELLREGEEGEEGQG